MRTLVLLAALTAGAVAAAGWSVAVRSRAALPEAAGGPLFPGLTARLNDAARLEVVGNGGRVTLARGADGVWTVVQKDGYRAAPDMVKALVLALAEARVREPRTALPDLYPRIGVEDPETPGAASTGVTLSAADGTRLAALVLGKPAASGSAVYARRAGEAPSWLVEAAPGAVETEPLRWIDTALPRVPPDAVAALEIRQPDGRTAVLRRDAPAAAPTLEALAQIVPLDVAGADPSLFQEATVTTVRGVDGAALTLRTAWRDGQAWVAFDAAGHEGWRYRVFDAVGRALTRTPEELATEGKS